MLEEAFELAFDEGLGAPRQDIFAGGQGGALLKSFSGRPRQTFGVFLQPLPVEGCGIAGGHLGVGYRCLLCPREGHGRNMSAQPGKNLPGSLHGRQDLRVCLVEILIAGQADPPTFDTFSQPADVIVHGNGQGGGVVWIVAGDDLQEEGGIFDPARHRPGVVEVPAQWDHPAQAHPPGRGFNPTVPHSEDGMRIDPPVSEPSEPKHSPAATAAAEPPDDPPVTRSRFQGL